MIDFYTSTTPNGYKVAIALEELALPYEVKRLDLGKNEQKRPEYLAINPNGRIPAIIDHDVTPPVTVFESGAILIYLAEKSGRLLPASGPGRAATLGWLMFQMSGVGPMFGQLGFFLRQADKNAGAIERYTAESKRLLSVLQGRLHESDYLAGEYSIADIAMYPWLAAAGRILGAEGFAEFPSVRAYVERMAERPAVARGMKIPA